MTTLFHKRHKLGLSRMELRPLNRYWDHEVRVLDGESHISKDERLRIHFVLQCKNCEKESIVRGHLPPEYQDFEERATLAKFICVGKYTRVECKP